MRQDDPTSRTMLEAIPAIRIGHEWRFALKNLREGIANSSQADQLTAALRNGRVVPRRG